MKVDEGVPKSYKEDQLLSMFDDQTGALFHTYNEYTSIHGQQIDSIDMNTIISRFGRDQADLVEVTHLTLLNLLNIHILTIL
jgi:hypothetical protein